MKTDKTAEIYIHIPFCKRKCDYCDFVSFVTDSDTRDRYFDMLIKEIDAKAESMGKLPIDSVFFGGGTPSLAEIGQIEAVLERLRSRFDFVKKPEITIEMNPNSAEKDKIKAYREMGINRVSIGLQSADNSELKTLSRLHNYEEFLRTFDYVREAGFDNVNVDLMSAIPGQTLSSYKETLAKVINLNPEHISAYSLILEEGTPFFTRYETGVGLPDEEEEREMYYMTRNILGAAGYKRYETSNYAKPGMECRHNVGYWRRRPYIGFGIAAASLYDDIRYTKHSNLKTYLEGDFSEEKEELSKEDMEAEFMFLGLRMTDGVSVREFNTHFSENIFNKYGEVIDELEGDNLMAVDGDRIYLTDRGMDLANYCMAKFV